MLTRLKDYTNYLDDNFRRIERDWVKNPSIHSNQLMFIMDCIKGKNIKSVLEIGCGSGHLAKLIPLEIKYTGFDKSHIAIKKAKLNRRASEFIEGDIRTANLPSVDLVISFATMKHFSLDEWKDVLCKALSPGKYGIFSIPVSESLNDDGIDFHHVWVTSEYLENTLEELGYNILKVDKSTCEWNIFVEKK